MTTITLQEPIKWGSETITELTLRKPKAKDLRRFPTQPTTGDILDLAATLSGRPSAVIDELDVPDMLEICEVIGKRFLRSTPVTGEMDSEL